MCTFPDCRDDQDGFVSECSNLPMLLLLKSLIYSGVFVIVALFLSSAKIGFIKKGTEYCVCLFVCDDTLLFSI